MRQSGGFLVWASWATALSLLQPQAVLSQARSLAEIIRDARSAVVHLRTFDADGRPLGDGSGFIIEDGRIATNVHVVEGAARVEVLDDDGRLLGAVDHASSLSASVDLAILPALDAQSPGLSFALADPEVGETAIAIGSPQGLTNTVSEGIVSAVRDIGGRRRIQITAPISPGSSGGPVLNDQGRVIGVSVSQMQEGQNLNFAVPVLDLIALAGSPPGRMTFPASGSGAAQPPATVSETVASLPFLNVDSVESGALGPSSFELDDRYLDAYRFEGMAGQTVTIIAASEEIDTSLELAYIDAQQDVVTIAEDDDGAVGTNSMIVQRLPLTGTYVIGVSSYGEGERGTYSVVVLTGDVSAEVLAFETGVTSDADSRWTPVSGTDAFTSYLDVTSVRRLREGVYEAWYRTDYDTMQRLEGEGEYEYTNTLEEVDCQRRRGRTLEITYYSADGRPLESFDWSDDSLRAWRPGSVAEAKGEAVCAAVP